MNFTETIILSRVSQLIDIAKRGDVKIKFVDLVSPGQMNGSERWKMEPLREIWLCTGDEYPNLRAGRRSGQAGKTRIMDPR